MPKMKTNRGAAKRFKRRGNGTIKRRRATRNHILTKKAQKKKRQDRTMAAVNKADHDAIDRMI